MTLAIAQTILLLLAGAALFRLWRGLLARDRSVGLIVGAGLALRALAGQALFWISWLDLIPRGSLHVGYGIWFFGLDGSRYMNEVFSTIYGTVMPGIQQAPDGSAFYRFLLTAFAFLFGVISSVALLLNLYCYVTMCWLITRIAPPAARSATLFALCALSFSPASILWSLQPLKESLTYLLFVACIGAALLWQRGALPWRWNWLAAGGAALCASLAALTATRWYLGLALLGAASAFLFLILVRAPVRRVRLFTASAVVLLLLTQAFSYGGGKGIPRVIRSRVVMAPPATRARMFPPVHPKKSRPNTNQKDIPDSAPLGTALVSQVENSRVGFVETTGAATEVVLLRGKSRVAQLAAGLVATTLPHFLIAPLGFIRIGGGRSMFWLTDLDTLLMIAVVMTGLVMTWRRRRTAFRSPALWLVLVLVMLVTAPLVYTVTNFGTLFRMRGMMYTLMVLLPLVGTMTPDRESER